jgi:hypothetical protein
MAFIYDNLIIPEIAGRMSFNGTPLMKVAYNGTIVWSVTPLRIASIDIIPILVVGTYFEQKLVSVSITDTIVVAPNGIGYVVDYDLEREYHITDGELPPGLSLYTDGTLSGIPLTSGTYNFTVKVNIIDGEYNHRNYCVYVRERIEDPAAEFQRLIDVLVEAGRVFITQPEDGHDRYFMINGNLSEPLQLPSGSPHSGNLSYIEELPFQPSAPKIVRVIRDLESLTVFWDRPQFDGNAPIFYQITIDDFMWIEATRELRQFQVMELDVESIYNIVVRGKNDFNIGKHSDTWKSYPSIVAKIIVDGEVESVNDVNLSQTVENIRIDNIPSEAIVIKFDCTETTMTITLDVNSL